MPRTARRQRERRGQGYVEWELTIYVNSRPNCLLTEFGCAANCSCTCCMRAIPGARRKTAPAFAACRPSMAVKKNAALLRRFSRAQ